MENKKMSIISEIKFYKTKYLFPALFMFWITWVGLEYFKHYMEYAFLIKIKEILLFIFIILIIWAIGRTLFRLTKIECSHFLESNIFAFALGLGFWSYFIFFLGVLGCLYSKVIIIFFIMFGVLSFKEMKNIFIAIKYLCLDKKFSFSLWGLILGFAFFLSFLGALGPIVSTDALRYHLSIPNLYLLNHKIINLPNNLFSNFPAVMNMLYLFSLSLESQSLAKMLHWLTGVLTSLAIYSFGKKFFNFRLGIIAASIFFITPVILILSSVAFIDLGLVFFFFLSVYALCNYETEKRIYYLIISAVFSGLAVSTKYSGGIFILILGLLFFYKRFIVQKNKLYPIIKELALFYSIVLIIMSPWLLKNLFYTQNPFYPFLFNIFGGKENILYLNIVNNVGIKINRWNWFWLPFVIPWHATFEATHFENWRLGIIYIVFLPGLLLLKKINQNIKYLMYYCLFVYLIWVYFAQNVRFLLPIFPVLSIVSAYIILELTTVSKNSKRDITGDDSSLYIRKIFSFANGLFGFFIKGALAGMLLWNINDFVVRSPYFIPQRHVFFSEILREQYLKNELSFYDVFEYINKHVPASSKILFLGQYKEGGYLKRKYLYSSEFEQNILFSLLYSSDSMEALLRELKAREITHVLFNNKELNNMEGGIDTLNADPDKKNIFDDFLGKYLKKICEKNEIVLYEIKYENNS